MNGPGERILIVDDSQPGLYAKSRVLRRAGYEVLQAMSGQEALSLLASERPRLIVLDVCLPDVNGVELCRQIKNDPSTASVIVLQVSATYVREVDVERALDSGADAALTEPLDPGVLRSTVRALLRARTAEDALREALQREQEARNSAEAVNRVKDEFLATLSHELRSPLGAILTWTRLLATQPLEPERSRHAIAAIERNARLQMKLVADLLDVSRIISGKLSLELHPVALQPVIDGMVDAVRSELADKGLAIEVLAAPPIHVRADEARLQQVISNLLSNALKFTPPGGRIAVETKIEGDRAVIRVLDTGEGIAPEFLPHIFDRFRQADSSTTRRVGGLGLGLAIVHHLVTLHGGEVSAASEGLGRGATIEIRIPLASQPPPTAIEAPSARADAHAWTDLNGVSVMVVDDEVDAREAVAAVLEQSGALVTSCGSVAEALAELESRTPDVIVSDIGMPNRDGFSLVTELRRRQDDLRRLPVLALTAYAAAEDRRRILDRGFDRWLSKPVEPAELTAAIAAMVRGRAASSVPT